MKKEIMLPHNNLVYTIELVKTDHKTLTNSPYIVLYDYGEKECFTIGRERFCSTANGTHNHFITAATYIAENFNQILFNHFQKQKS